MARLYLRAEVFRPWARVMDTESPRNMTLAATPGARGGRFGAGGLAGGLDLLGAVKPLGRPASGEASATAETGLSRGTTVTRTRAPAATAATAGSTTPAFQPGSSFPTRMGFSMIHAERAAAAMVAAQRAPSRADPLRPVRARVSTRNRGQCHR